MEIEQDRGAGDSDVPVHPGDFVTPFLGQPHCTASPLMTKLILGYDTTLNCEVNILQFKEGIEP